MIEMKNKRFFTLIKNKVHLREYCRTFGAKMMVVKANLKKEQILDLARLVPALCDKNYKIKKVNIEVIKSKFG
jgi:hypothetical protein